VTREPFCRPIGLELIKLDPPVIFKPFHQLEKLVQGIFMLVVLWLWRFGVVVHLFLRFAIERTEKDGMLCLALLCLALLCLALPCLALACLCL
jgi:hypothetical protein